MLCGFVDALDALGEVREDPPVRIDERLAAFLLATEPPLHRERIVEPGGEGGGAEREVRGGVGLVHLRVPRGVAAVVRARRHHRLLCRSFREPELTKFRRDRTGEVRDERGGEVAANFVDLLLISKAHGLQHERLQVVVAALHVARVREERTAGLLERVVRDGVVRVEHVGTEVQHVAHGGERPVAAQWRPAFLELGHLHGDGVRIAPDVHGAVREEERVCQLGGRGLLAGWLGGEGGRGEKEREKEHEKPWLPKENSKY